MRNACLLFAILIPTSTSADVVLYFTSPTCVPCRRTSAIASRMQREGKPIKFVDVSTVEGHRLAARLRIDWTPTFLLLRDGREVARVERSTDESRISGLIRQARRPATKAAPVSSGPFASPEKKAAVVAAAPTRSPRRSVSAQIGATLKNQLASAKSRFRDVALSPARLGFSQTDSLNTAHSAETVIRAKHDGKGNLFRSNKPVSVCVRIRVVDDSGISFGSGTIIDCRPGRAIILTCGHIFRHVPANANVEVDLFGGSGTETYIGRLLGVDEEADLGLVSLSAAGRLPVARVADQKTSIVRYQPVTSIGCGGGEAPTVESIQITRINRYQGPENTECTGLPIPGRSGGGLFTRDGSVIGVCIAADPTDRRGLYTGLPPIHRLLDRYKLTGLYRSSVSEASIAAKPGPSKTATRSKDSQITTKSRHIARIDRTQVVIPSESRTRPWPTTATKVQSGSVGTREFVTRTHDRLINTREAEVICIIRPLNDPTAETRVVIINRATPEFLTAIAKYGGHSHGMTNVARRLSNGRRSSAVDQTTYRPADVVAERTSKNSQRDAANPNSVRRYTRSVLAR